MSKTNNPTRTLSIEKRWIKEITRSYSSFNRDVSEKLQEYSKGMQTNAVIGLNVEQQKLFMSWLLTRIEELTGEPAPLNWQNQYQLESYIRAVESTRQSLISQGADISLTDAEIVQSQGFEFTATATLGSASVAPAIHQDALEFLFTRSYESLKGWNDALAKEVRQITFDAVKNGEGITETTKKIKERTGVAKSRAELIARTETISAYREGSISETERAAQELDEELKMRWITALDGRVRHLHATFHGTIDTPEETRRKGAISPFNCRCSQIPVIPGVNDTEKRNAKYSEQRKQMLQAEKGI